jgi:DnaJ-class molecular chaperone
MSKYRNIIEVQVDKDTPASEEFLYRGFTCPRCHGKGFRCESRKNKPCEFCDATGKLKAHITIDFLPDHD